MEKKAASVKSGPVPLAEIVPLVDDAAVRPYRGYINNSVRKIKLRTTNGKIKRITDGN